LRLRCSRTLPPAGSRLAGCLEAPAALLGSTTEIYLHVAMDANGLGFRSPLDSLDLGSSGDEEELGADSLQVLATAGGF